jgi:hypothetical protein
MKEMPDLALPWIKRFAWRSRFNERNRDAWGAWVDPSDGWQKKR